jgi:hypothetical protein
MAKNRKRQFNEAKNYYFCTHVDNEGYVYQLLLTEHQFNAAIKRADNNPEDVYKDYIVLQGIRNGNNPYRPEENDAK